ncbi:MAG TPA: class I SAM-dependent methyltransferase [Acidobacteriaceae bacterium]|nr:class I SAM-dependent methyltransferase [Acidobacteriaceae bacterium]
MIPVEHAPERPLMPAAPSALEKVLAGLAASLPAGTAFEFQLPDRPLVRVGSGEVTFRVVARNERAVRALKSMDEIGIGEAYLFGDLDIDGDLVAAMDLRNSLHDRHVLAYLWSTYGQRIFYGQTKRDRQWIHEHYDTDPEFYLTFLDERYRCYSHAYFENDDEELGVAMERKFETAFRSCNLQPGWRVLDIGAGWGAFTQYAGERGVHVTSLTISAESEKYCNELIARCHLPCEVVREHFLEYQSREPFDAIINFGVTEHLPDYPRTFKQYQCLLKPGRRVYADACASRTKFPFSSFVLKYVWPGNTTPLHLASYLDAMSETPFEICMIQNDRHSYLLTAKRWAENLDRKREEIVARWGEMLYRRFRLYLWGCVHCLTTDSITAYRWLMQLPAGSTERTTFVRQTPAGMVRAVKRALRF